MPGWERFVRRLRFREGRSVPDRLPRRRSSPEIATALRVAFEVIMHPFSFGRPCGMPGRPCRRSRDFLDGPARSALERSFSTTFCRPWRFPGGAGNGHGHALPTAADYVDVATLRDVVERHSVSNVTGLRWLVLSLAGQLLTRSRGRR